MRTYDNFEAPPPLLYDSGRQREGTRAPHAPALNTFTPSMSTSSCTATSPCLSVRRHLQPVLSLLFGADQLPGVLPGAGQEQRSLQGLPGGKRCSAAVRAYAVSTVSWTGQVTRKCNTNDKFHTKKPESSDGETLAVSAMPTRSRMLCTAAAFFGSNYAYMHFSVVRDPEGLQSPPAVRHPGETYAEANEVFSAAQGHSQKDGRADAEGEPHPHGKKLNTCAREALTDIVRVV